MKFTPGRRTQTRFPAHLEASTWSLHSEAPLHNLCMMTNFRTERKRSISTLTSLNCCCFLFPFWSGREAMGCGQSGMIHKGGDVFEWRLFSYQQIAVLEVLKLSSETNISADIPPAQQEAPTDHMLSCCWKYGRHGAVEVRGERALQWVCSRVLCCVHPTRFCTVNTSQCIILRLN